MRDGRRQTRGAEASAAASGESDVVGHKRNQFRRELVSLGVNDPEIAWQRCPSAVGARAPRTTPLCLDERDLHDVLGEEPDLHLVAAEDVAHQ